MADNITLNAGSGGATLATDDDGTAQHQYVKLEFGTAGIRTKVDASNPLPVDLGANNDVTVTSGTVTANLGTIADVATDTTLAAASAKLPATLGQKTKVASLSVTVASDDTVPVSAASLPLPSGAATAANQSTGNTSLSTIAGDTTSIDAKIVAATTADLDSGVGTDTVQVHGIAVAASGGAAVITGDAANGLDVDVTRVSGTVTVDGSGVTQPVSAASLPLPTGAATAANQLPDGHNVTVDNASGASAVNIQDGGNSITVDGTVTANAGTNLNTSALALDATLTNKGQFSRVTDGTADLVLATVGTVSTIPVTLFDGTGNLIGATGTVPVSVSGALPAGTANVGNVGLAPRTSGGLSMSKTISSASTNATSVKVSAGQLYGWYVHNENTGFRYLKLYDKATAPTVGVDAPVMTIGIVGGGGANVEFANGLAFGTGIAFALTTGIADADTGAVAANEIAVNLMYK